jgi:hypothetical protein
MNHAEFLRQAKQALCVTNKQKATWIEAMVKLIDQAFLFCFVEINHDVAAQDNVVAPRQEFGFQVVEVELDQFF